jgi:hypothetical protein
MSRIEVFYRESFSGECGHTETDLYDGDIEMKDGGILVHWNRSEDHKRMRSFYPNISIIRLNIEEE